MATFKVEIEGKHDLEQINLQIAREEAAASEFQDSRVEPKDTKPTNVVTFLELEPGTIPTRLAIVKDGDPPPPNTRRVWSGVMIVNNSMTAVTGHRIV
jgi:hypothetical protein